MNWLQKVANINFQLKDHNKISKPKNISDMCFGLISWAEQNLPKHLIPQNLNYDFITPDGWDWDNLTGTINWYIPDNITIEQVLPFTEKAIDDYLTPLGIKIGQIHNNKSNLFKLNTLRIPIIQNDTAALTDIPYLDISVRNGAVLCDMLNIPHNGSININELEQKVKNAWNKIQHFTIPETKSVNFDSDENLLTNPRFFDGGLNHIQLERYLRTLQQIIDVARKLNLPNPTVVW